MNDPNFSIVSVLGGMFVVVALVVLLVLYAIAPLMLFGINSKLEEANLLLRFIAERITPAPPARPVVRTEAPAEYPAEEPTMFRSLR